MATREEAIARIRAILAELNCTIIREPDGWAGFVAALPGGEQFFIKADSVRYNGPCRIELSSSWGQYPTVSGSGYGRAERGLAQLSSSSFLERGEEGLGSPSIDPDRPLTTILKDLERRFFSRLRELWPRAEAYRAQRAKDVEKHLETAARCAFLKASTKAGYALSPRRISHAGEYVSFELDIPAEKLALFFVWCEENGVAR